MNLKIHGCHNLQINNTNTNLIIHNTIAYINTKMHDDIDIHMHCQYKPFHNLFLPVKGRQVKCVSPQTIYTVYVKAFLDKLLDPFKLPLRRGGKQLLVAHLARTTQYATETVYIRLNLISKQKTLAS